MSLSQSDKILLTAAGLITISSFLTIKEVKKYEKQVRNLQNQLIAIYYLNNQINSNILAGNEQIDEGNRIMRKIIQKSISEEAEGYK